MKQKKGSQIEMDIIEKEGFTHIKYYDTDLNYIYYDALMNNAKVEVRMKDGIIEWRYLGVSLEELEWFKLEPLSNDDVDENSTIDNEISDKDEIDGMSFEDEYDSRIIDENNLKQLTFESV